MKLPPLSRNCLLFLTGCLATVVHAQALRLNPFKPSGIYAVGEKVGWTVALPAGATAPAGGYTYTVKRDALVVVQSGPVELTPAGGRIELTLDRPGMLYLEVTSPAGAGARSIAGAAVAPTALEPGVSAPADFDAFWQAKIALLKSIAPEPVLTAGESEKEGVLYETLQLNHLDGSHVYGQLARPNTGGKFPALLILQWAGGPYPLDKHWVTDRAAEGWLALNIEPHDVPGNLPPAFYAALPSLIKKYHTLYDDDRDRNYFLRMYLGAYRAVDYLTSRPDWNGEVMVVSGTSMGGEQSLAVAGLHPKITHVLVHVPAGADAHALLHERLAGYPNWDHQNPKVLETARYFDTVNFAPRIKAHCLVSMGFLDQTCPPAGIWIAYNQIAGPKEAVPLVDAAHNHQSTAEQQRPYTDRANAWLAALVKGQDAPSVGATLAAK